jgi:hypothetical protein
MQRLALSSLVAVSLFACVPDSEVSVESGSPAPTPPVGIAAEPLTAEPFLPSLSPHRLSVSGSLAAVSDPEGAGSDGRAPMVHVLDLTQGARVASLALPDGSNPGAIEIDGSKGWVVARGAGGIYELNLTQRKLGRFRRTCAAPVDLVISKGLPVVACRSGEVVTVIDGVATSVFISPNLTSIVLDTSGRILVSDATAHVYDVLSLSAHPSQPMPVLLNDPAMRSMKADSARRLVRIPNGKVVMLYQQTIEGELVDKLSTNGPPGGSMTGGGGYGGPGSCAIPAVPT